MNRNIICFRKTVFFIGITKRFAVLKVTTGVQMLFVSINTGAQSFCHSFIALSKIGCSKSAQKSAVQVCQVATVDMESAQLVLNQFLNTISK